ncbi:uncharacterized protein RHO25_003168 [Cercospora beticola]|uniref:Uncharacterized protein n=1 Tax=Cercospora beticola TaxID=122368 RepID=A0ABZ0NGC1_CERBT|nr:hypothetical protein RHO25_003168 [Cercospora beticola]
MDRDDTELALGCNFTFSTPAFIRLLSMAGGNRFRAIFSATGIAFFPPPVLRDHKAACLEDRPRRVTASVLLALPEE